MSSTIVFAPSAKRKISSGTLPVFLIDAALAFIKGDLREKPRIVGKPLRGDLVGTWSAVRGAYRILYRIDDEDQLVTIIDIAHRADVYRPR